MIHPSRNETQWNTLAPCRTTTAFLPFKIKPVLQWKRQVASCSGCSITTRRASFPWSTRSTRQFTNPDDLGLTFNFYSFVSYPQNGAAMTDFTLGVNYWPRRKAMYWWNDFDAGEVREEFSIIREIGLNVVRIFLLWDDFQPQPTSVSKEAIDHLVKVADIAGENDL